MAHADENEKTLDRLRPRC